MFGRAGLRSAPFRQGLLPSKPRSGTEPGGSRNRANPLTSEIDPAELDQSHRIFSWHDLTRKPVSTFRDHAFSRILISACRMLMTQASITVFLAHLSMSYFAL